MIADAAQVIAGGIAMVWAIKQANSHRAHTPLTDRIAIAIIGAAAVMAAVAVPASKMPVVVDAYIRPVSHAPGNLRVQLYGTKPQSRKGCEFIGADAYVVEDGSLMEAPFVIERDPNPGNTRPAGKHNFGTWSVTYPAQTVVSHVLIRAHHKCAWWMPVTHTDLGPFSVSPPAADIPQPNGMGNAGER